MSSLRDLAAVRTAVELCNNPELKTEILSAPGSVYDKYKKHRPDKYHLKISQWQRTLEKKTANILKNLGLIKPLWEKVTHIVILIGTRMVIWAKYHEKTLDLSREFSIRFFNTSFFTPQGIVDNKKAAEELMKDKSLRITQKYKLACLYCFTEHIFALYLDMTTKDEEEFYVHPVIKKIKQPEIVTFWSQYLMGQIDELRGEKSLDQYRMETAVKSGSKAAVEYCLEKTSLSRNKDAVIDAALETVRTKYKRGISDDLAGFQSNQAFYMQESWIPSDYFVDTLYFLLSKMREDQLIDFLKKDIEGSHNDEFGFGIPIRKHSRVLEYLLNWPYQNSFMKTAQLMWGFLPERSYSDLLLKICAKMNPAIGNIKYCEEKSYDYKKLFKEFWRQSPDHYKRYLFSDKQSELHIHGIQILNGGKELLIKLFTLGNFTYGDWENIELILSSATDEEKERIIYYKKGKNVCIELMKEEKWEMMGEFVSNCFPSKEKSEDFKRRLSLTEAAQRACVDFIRRDNWNAAESFVKWSSLSVEEIIRLKKNMIYHEEGMRVCCNKIECGKSVKTVDKFIRWCFPSEEEATAFKRDLFSTAEIGELIIQLVIGDQLEFVDELFNWAFSSEEEIIKVKKGITETLVCPVCEQILSENTVKIIYHERFYFPNVPATKYQGRKWEDVEKLMTWCFSSEEEIGHFKRYWLLRVSGKAVHFNLIKSSQWGEAEMFFSWLGLSPEEVRELKRETLFNHEESYRLLRALMNSKNEPFSYNGTKQDVAPVELLLRWCLADKETVLAFRDHFKQRYDRGIVTEGDRAVLEEFDSAILQRLSDLEEDQKRDRKVGPEET